MRPDDHRVRAMRSLLAEARADNARMVAAAIGGHLSRIGRAAGPHDGLDEATEVVRDASLDLLKALHHGKDVIRARQVALASVATLEAALPDQSAMTPLAPKAAASRPGFDPGRRIRELARGRLAAVLPLWRN